MNSTSNPAATNPDAVMTARADERLARVYEQIAQADEQLARVTEQLSKMEHDAMPHPSVISSPRPSPDRTALRGFVGIVLAAGIGGAAYASQSEAARSTIAQWAPQLVSTTSPWSQKAADSAQPRPPGVQLAAADTAPGQSAPPAQDAAPAPAPVSPELTQLLQAMARDITAVEQGIEQLKANQERMAADNAREIEQLKASQEQMTRLAAKPPEPDPRAKTPVPAPRPVAGAAAAPKPQPKQPPQQARAHTQPVQLQPKPQ